MNRSTDAQERFRLYMAGLGRNPRQYELVVKQWDWKRNPMSLLYTFAYKQDIEQAYNDGVLQQAESLILDSGAYTAFSSGNRIHLDDYMEWVDEFPHKFNEVVALDVIDDPNRGYATWENSMTMSRRGLRVIPVFHQGDEWEYLGEYCKRFRKVGLSVTSGANIGERREFLMRCFREYYPHRFHGFGIGGRTTLEAYPFNTVDTTTFAAAGFRYGNWTFLQGMKGKCKARKDEAFKLSRMEIIKGLELEKQLRGRWAREINKQANHWEARHERSKV